MSINDFKDLMPHTITHEAVSGRDDRGKPTYATGVVYRARVFPKVRRIVSRVTGLDEVSDGQIWVGTRTSDDETLLTNLDPDDRITLPDGSQPRIISWAIPTDEVGNHHTKIYTGGSGGRV